MMRKFSAFLFASWVTGAGTAGAQTLNQEMTGLADKLSRALVMQGFKNVAAMDFTDLQGRSTELGRFLSERLTVEIVSTGGVSMVDRANIKSILAEHKLTEEGLVNPANAKKLGEFAGVDAILLGNAITLDSGIELLVKAVATESSKLVAAGRITFPKTTEIQQLLNRSISANPNGPRPATGGDATYEVASPIATKDIGPLRVVLKSMSPLKLTDTRGRSARGIRCAFEFISLETQRTIAVAMNAIGSDGSSMGRFLRSSLVDENGGTWRLPNSSVMGIAAVGVGASQSDPSGALLRRGVNVGYDPAEIGRVLSKRDDLGSDEATDRSNNSSFRFIFGSTTEMSPGQSLTVTMSFVQDDNATTSERPAKAFQIATEIVTGVPTKGAKRSYSLHNVVFDRVSVFLGDGG